MLQAYHCVRLEMFCISFIAHSRHSGFAPHFQFRAEPPAHRLQGCLVCGIYADVQVELDGSALAAIARSHAHVALASLNYMIERGLNGLDNPSAYVCTLLKKVLAAPEALHNQLED